MRSANSGDDTLTARARSTGAWILLLFVRAYITFLSPFFGGACKFYPSCSNFAREAIARHGARRGSVLALKRLLRCRPFTQGGFDPVPGGVGSSGTAAAAMNEFEIDQPWVQRPLAKDSQDKEEPAR